MTADELRIVNVEVRRAIGFWERCDRLLGGVIGFWWEGDRFRYNQVIHHTISIMVEWDGKKAKGNLVKHGISFIEAISVLDDPYVLTLDDPLHSIGELRFLAVGYSEQNNLLAVVYTERNSDIRVISARPVTRQERKMYEQDL